MTIQAQEDWFDPDATTFGDRLAGAREAAGMSQKDLSRRLGIKLRTLKAWENDISEPRANRLSMIAGLLNVSLSWLLTGHGEGPETPEVGEDMARDMLDVLTEMRDVKIQIAAATDRLGRLEKSLRGMIASDTSRQQAPE